MREGRNVSYLPIYGVEMRGGTADCTVVMSSQEIGSPLVERADAVIVMNQTLCPSMKNEFEKTGCCSSMHHSSSQKERPVKT